MKVLRIAERWQRAAWAQQRWAEPAKECVDFVEGRQWTAAQLAAMHGKRQAMKFNVIAPVVRLVLGYQRNNKTDITFSPGQDSQSSEQVAETLTQLEKLNASQYGLGFVDTEVFLDGLISGRAYYDTRLDYDHNDLGECKTTAKDPFSIYPDPDASSYDLNETASYIQESKLLSIDEIEVTYGRDVAKLIKPFTMGQTPVAPLSSLVINDEVTPVRTFGLREDTTIEWWDTFYSMMGDFVDTYRKTIRIVQTQHKVREMRNVVIDLETGDTEVLPLNWAQDKIEKALLFAELAGNPCIVQRRQVERVHWTDIAGDLMLYDKPSIYSGFTLTGYFPYFRRGMTRGMVEDLIDPQKEKNKRRSARIETVQKTANGGWLYHQDMVDPTQEANIKKWGSVPGVNIKYKGNLGPPVQIQPGAPPIAHERLEHDSDEDIRHISGINESMLGDDGKVQSGRAILARQRQAVISVQMYMDNMSRSKHLLGQRHLDIYTRQYTEHRMYRVTGEDGKYAPLYINQPFIDPATGATRIENDLTVGKYAVVVDESPMSATYQSAQFDEAMTLMEKLAGLGPLAAIFGPLIIGLSSLSRKDDWIAAMQQAGAVAPPPPAGKGGAPGGGNPRQLPQQTPAEVAAGGGGNVVPMPMR